jgi:hypothetical protein
MILNLVCICGALPFNITILNPALDCISVYETGGYTLLGHRCVRKCAPGDCWKKGNNNSQGDYIRFSHINDIFTLEEREHKFQFSGECSFQQREHPEGIKKITFEVSLKNNGPTKIWYGKKIGGRDCAVEKVSPQILQIYPSSCSFHST